MARCSCGWARSRCGAGRRTPRRSRPPARSCARVASSPSSRRARAFATPTSLGHPRRGAGRLALETGAPLVPAAIVGSERLFLGPIPKPRRVQVAFAEPIPVAELTASPEEAARLVERMLWPEVEEEFRRLRARPGLIAAALAALGIGGGLLLRRRRR